MQMKQRVHKHSVEKRWPGYTTSLAGQKKRKKNVGRAIHIAGHNFAHTHIVHGDTPRRTACRCNYMVTLLGGQHVSEKAR